MSLPRRRPHVVVSMALALAAVGSAADARAEDLQIVPVLRVALGPSIHVAPTADEGTRLAADVTAGVAVAPGGVKKLIFNPELGYAFDGIGAHAFNLTVGVGFGHPLAYVSYQPRLLAGRAGGGTMMGMRNGLALHLLVDMMSLELAHQLTHFAGDVHHGVNIMFGVNPAAFVYVIAELGK